MSTRGGALAAWQEQGMAVPLPSFLDRVATVAAFGPVVREGRACRREGRLRVDRAFGPPGAGGGEGVAGHRRVGEGRCARIGFDYRAVPEAGALQDGIVADPDADV